jgi:hypothetical protein
MCPPHYSSPKCFMRRRALEITQTRSSIFLCCVCVCVCVCVGQQPCSGLGGLTVDDSRSHTHTHTHTHKHTHTHTHTHIWWDSSERVITLSQGRYLHNAQQTRYNINALSGIQTRDPSSQAAIDHILRTYGHRDRLHVFTRTFLSTSLCLRQHLNVMVVAETTQFARLSGSQPRIKPFTSRISLRLAYFEITC